MATKLRFGTRERIDYRRGKHVITRRTPLSYDRLMQLAVEQAHADFLRHNGQFQLIRQGRKG